MSTFRRSKRVTRLVEPNKTNLDCPGKNSAVRAARILKAKKLELDRIQAFNDWINQQSDSDSETDLSISTVISK